MEGGIIWKKRRVINSFGAITPIACVLYSNIMSLEETHRRVRPSLNRNCGDLLCVSAGHQLREAFITCHKRKGCNNQGNLPFGHAGPSYPRFTRNNFPAWDFPKAFSRSPKTDSSVRHFGFPVPLRTETNSMTQAGAGVIRCRKIFKKSHLHSPTAEAVEAHMLWQCSRINPGLLWPHILFNLVPLSRPIFSTGEAYKLIVSFSSRYSMQGCKSAASLYSDTLCNGKVCRWWKCWKIMLFR